MRKYSLFLFFLLMPLASIAQSSDSIERQSKRISSVKDLIYDFSCSSCVKITFQYPSVDEVGKDIMLSALMIAETDALNTTCIQTDKVVLYCPYTHFSNNECATVNSGLKVGFEQKTYTGGYIMIIPDGEGFGITKDRTQLYLNHEVWARQVSDCMKFSINLISYLKEQHDAGATKLYPKLKDDYKTIIAGSSQGAGVALATLRYMETHEVEGVGHMMQSMADYYHVDFANICCGPYDPVTTVKTYFTKWYRISYPCVIPMTIKSMMASYPDIMAGVKEEDFFTPEYLAIKSEVDEAIDSKKKTADDINAIIFKYFSHSQTNQSEVLSMLDGNGGTWVTEFLRQDVIDFSSYAAKQLVKCLQKNIIVDGTWIPKHFIKYQCSDYDAVVPYENTLELDKYVTSGNYNRRKTARSHVDGCGYWVLNESLTSRNFTGF